MKFWQKTFILTLALFLLCFAVGIFSVAVYFNGQLSDSCESTCLSEQFYIVKSFTADSEYTAATGQDMGELIMSYCDYYKNEGIILAVDCGGERSVTTDLVTEGLMDIAFAAKTEGDERVYFQRRVDGVRYIFIKSPLEDGSLTYIKDISYLDEDFEAMTWIFACVVFGVSAVLALILFLLLKKLSRPLSILTESTAAVARGDYSVRASVKGEDEFASLADGFNYMTEQISDQIGALEAVAEQKQQLVDDLSHEMRTPLTSIHGYAEYLLNAAVGEEERIDALICIMNESERLSKLGQSLMDISYVQNKPLTLSPVALSPIFDSIRDRFAMQLKNEGVELILPKTDTVVNGDATLLELLISNLCDNAIKACRGREERRVTVSVVGSRICVTDTGRGMKSEELRHITEPFYRTDKSRSRADGGAGLGLALCLRIAEAHGGKLEFTSEIDKGTTATVTLK